MALAQPLAPHRDHLPHGPSYPTEAFDVDLLCAKLEVAKLEQDAERARQRLRQLTSRQRDDVAPTTKQNDAATNSHWRYSTAVTTEQQQPTRPRFFSDARHSPHPKQLFTAVSVERSDSDQSRKSPHLPVQSPRADQWQFPPRTSWGESNAVRFEEQPRTDLAQRKPLARTSESDTSITTSQRQSLIERPGSRGMANRRSNTFPSQPYKLPLKHHSMTASEYAAVKEPLSPPPRAKTMPITHEPTDSSMGLVNEYTISFDLADYPREKTSFQSPENTKVKNRHSQDALRSKSLLTLPTLLKKDRTQVKTEEINPSPPLEDAMSPRPSTAAHTWHSRQQSDFPASAPTSPQFKMEPQQSKRRSLVGWLKKL